jgi:two-component system, cell cycle sensor histidine kinase and response regulator CckA
MPPSSTPRPTTPDEPDSGPRALPWLRAGEVLLADDDQPIRRVLCRALERFGLTVTQASDGDEAVGLIAAAPQRFALVVLDVTMPRLDGDLALIQIRALAPAIPAIVLSGFLKEHIRERLDGMERVAVLQKPFTMRSLADALWDVLGPHAD